jgi:hypothetical protein
MLIVLLNIFILNYHETKSSDKFIKFIFSYEYPTLDFTNHKIVFLNDSNDECGPVISLIQYRINYNQNAFYKFPNQYCECFENDTLQLIIRSTIWFYNDSIPKPNLPDSISYNFNGLKKLRVVFVNDSAIVNIHWNFNELELNPFWQGDY